MTAGITQVRMENLRGISTTVDLGPKTLLVGANGCGKSSTAIAAQLALMGYIPGHDRKPAAVFANSSNDKFMAAGVTVGEHCITRSWNKGKTLSEEITIGDITQKAKAAQGMLQVALGKGHKVFDVDAFYDCTSTEMRRLILNLVADDKQLAKLMADEQKARDDKNFKQKQRQAADAVVAGLVESKSEEDKPAGDLDHLEGERKEVNEQIEALRTRVAEGEANEKARLSMKEHIGTIPKLVEQAEHLEQTMSEASIAIGLLGEEDGKLPPYLDQGEEWSEDLSSLMAAKSAAQQAVTKLEAEEPTMPSSLIDRDSEAGKIVLAAIADLVDMANVCDADTEGIVTSLQKLCASDEEMNLYRDALASWLELHGGVSAALDTATATAVALEKKEVQAHEKAVQEWNAQAKSINDRLDDQRQIHDKAKADISVNNEKLVYAQDCSAKLEGIGPGLDPNDRITLEGLQSREATLAEQIKPLIEYEEVNRQIEKSRLKAEKAEAEEEKAKEALQKAKNAQQEVVLTAAEALAERSKNILPYGSLQLYDDGKYITIKWDKGNEEPISRNTLSGGEQVTFDAATGHALAPEALVVIEVAEVDTTGLVHLLDHLTDAPCDMLLMSCHGVDGTTPDEWTVIEM